MVSDRAISTVADVTLALVIVSAAVVMMAVFLQETPDTHEPVTADRTAETVAGMTLTVEYDVRDAKGVPPELDWPDPGGGIYERAYHDTAAALLGDASVANATYDGRRPITTGDDFAEAVDGAVRTRLLGAETNVHLRAVWRPYEDASIEGYATAGPRPPPDEEVSTVTMTIPSGIEPNASIAELHGMSDRDRAEALADAIVAYHFPLEESTHGLESKGFQRKLTVYRYHGFLGVTGQTGEYEIDDEVGPLSRYEANVTELNQAIATDGTQSLATQMESEQRSFASAEAFEEWLTVDEVEITVRTWNP